MPIWQSHHLESSHQQHRDPMCTWPGCGFQHIQRNEGMWSCSCRAAVNTYIVSACVFCGDLRVLACGLVLRPMRRPHEHRATSSYHTCILVLVLALSRLMPSKVAFETHIRGITTYQNPSFPMKALDSTSTRSRHKWYWYQGTKKPAIPHVAGFRKDQLETQVLNSWTQ